MHDGHSLGQGVDAQILADGRVYLPGDSRDPLAGEIYDPVGDTWTFAGLQHIAHSGGVTARLQDGDIIIAGGTANGVMTPIAERFSPALATNEFYIVVSPTSQSAE